MIGILLLPGRTDPVGAQNWPPIVDHGSVGQFYDLTPEEISAAAELNLLFVDHSVGENISQGLNCYGSRSVAESPNFCRRFEHVSPELSAEPEWFQFHPRFDRRRWIYELGGSAYWRDWPDYVAGLLRDRPDWDVVILMPSYLVGPNGGWTDLEVLEAAYPSITFVYATSSLPRGAPNGTAAELVMQEFNREARQYALAHAKPLLDVADILSHDYLGRPCFDTRDGLEYCQSNGRCENEPDDGVDIPAICQNYTTELYGGHLGSVSGGMLRMAQAMWLMAARLAEGPASGPTPTGDFQATFTPSSPTRTPPAPMSTSTPTDSHRLVLPWGSNHDS